MAVANPRPVAAPPRRPDPPRGRKPFRDNTRLIIFGIVVLLAVLAGLLTLASRSARLAPDFLTEFVLYALSATNLTILVALVFVLARNIVDRWFNAPMNDVVSSANAIAADYYQEQQRLVSREAQRLARGLASIDLAGPAVTVHDVIADDVQQERVSLAEVYRVERVEGLTRVVPVTAMAAPVIPRTYSPTSANTLAGRT